MMTISDDIDRRILAELARDGRRSAAELAEGLGLSRQAVHTRVRALEKAGVIRGYHADVDPAALGHGLRAHLRLTLQGSAAKERELVRRLSRHPQVRTIHRVSGEDCFMVDVVCAEMQDVSSLLGELRDTGALQSSRTAFVLESLLERGCLGALEPARKGKK